MSTEKLDSPLLPTQDAKDWDRFRKHFVAREGFEPNCRDVRVIELYHYFTAGAHEVWEWMWAAVTKQPNEKGQPWATGDELIIAFVQGAQSWEYEKTRATMWPSDRNMMERIATERLLNGTLGKSSPNSDSTTDKH